MKILVTGGTGFVGGHLIGELLAAGGNQVTVLVRDNARLEACAFKGDVVALPGDLLSSAPLPEDTELVFHLAAVTKAVSPGEFTRVNLDGTRALMEKLQPLKKLHKVVLLSSLAAAGPNRDGNPLREETAAAPISLYGKSKLAQEEIVAAHCPAPYVIIRAPIVFGPGDMDMLDAFRIVSKGIIPILGRAQRRYSLIYVKDLVSGMIAAAFSTCRNETFYVANAEAVEWQSFMEQISLLLGGKKARKIVIPEALGRVLAEFSEMRIRAFGHKAIFNRDKFNEMKSPAWVCSAAKIEANSIFSPACRWRPPWEKRSPGTASGAFCERDSFLPGLVIPAGNETDRKFLRGLYRPIVGKEHGEDDLAADAEVAEQRFLVQLEGDLDLFLRVQEYAFILLRSGQVQFRPGEEYLGKGQVFVLIEADEELGVGRDLDAVAHEDLDLQQPFVALQDLARGHGAFDL